MEMTSPSVLHIKMTKWRGFVKLSKNAFLAVMQLYMSLCHRRQEGKKGKKKSEIKSVQNSLKITEDDQ